MATVHDLATQPAEPTTTIGEYELHFEPEKEREEVYDPTSPVSLSGTHRLDDVTMLQAIFDWPGLYELAEAVERLLDQEAKRRRSEVLKKFPRLPAPVGKERQYPVAVLLAAIIGARATGSLASCLTTMRDRAVWHGKLAPMWNGPTEVRFPMTGPSRDQVRHLRRRLTRIEGWRDSVEDMFQRVAIAQAIALGNFDSAVEVDWVNPSLSHALIGDGTVIGAYSQVTSHYDPVTGEVFHVGSRAKVNPRTAPALTDLTEDGKTHLRGLNMVSLLTKTLYGPVVLGTGYATGAEQWPVITLLDQLAPHLGGGAHTLLYDRVMTGYLEHTLMSKHGIRVVNKGVAAQKAKKVPAAAEGSEDDFDETPTQRELADQFLTRYASEGPYLRELADYPLRDDAGKPRAATTSEQRTLTGRWRAEAVAELHRSGQRLPVGVSAVENTSASSVSGSRNITGTGVALVPTKFAIYDTHEHATAEGVCRHVLYVDDHCLYSVEPDLVHGYLVKVATGTCRSSRRVRHAGRWGADDTWVMPCPRGDFEIVNRYRPTQDPRWSGNPDTPAPAPAPAGAGAGADKRAAGDRLRPLNRGNAQQFADHANFRNESESWNHWTKRTLPNGRAASLSVDDQVLDYLAVAALRNVRTWAAFIAAH